MSQNQKTLTVKILQHPYPVIMEVDSDARSVRWKLLLPQGYGFEALEILEGRLRIVYSYLAGPCTILEHFVRFDSRVIKNEAMCFLSSRNGAQLVTLKAPLESPALPRPA